jgi:O-antigen/teichoic acid export membrane protein
MSLSQKTVSAILWHFSQLLIRRGINIVVMLWLARILLPEDFGIMAMMTVFLAIGTTLMNSGFKQALIRRKGATQIDFDTVFFSNLILGILAYGILFLVSPLIADFYHEPRLIDLIRIAALDILINSFQVVQTAQLNRELNFRAELQTIVPAGVLSGIAAVALAYADYGVWVLVIQTLLFSLINTVLLWFKQGWRPSLSFSRNAFVKMYDFGYKLFLSGLLNVIFKNIYIIIISKFFEASIAGYYFFAEKIKDMVINQLISSIQTVTYSTLANVHDENERLKAGYRKIITIATFFLFPAMTLLAALTVPIFKLMMPEKWMPAALYLQLLCLAGLLDPVIYINSNLLKVKGRSDYILRLEILKKVLVVVVFSLSFNFGINGILIGQIISSILIFVPSSYISSKLINYSIAEQIGDFFENFLLAFIVGLIVYACVSYFAYEPLTLMLLGLLSPLLFLAFAYIFKLPALRLTREMVVKRMEKSDLASLKNLK